MAEPAFSSQDITDTAASRNALEHLRSFYVIYLSIFAFVVLSLATLYYTEAQLQDRFESDIAKAVRVSPVDGPVVRQIKSRVAEVLETSPWTRVGGVRVAVTVMGADGQTPIYVSGRVVPPPPAPNLAAAMQEASLLLPAISDVRVSVPPTATLSAGIFFGYASILLTCLIFHNRARARRERQQLETATALRNESAARASQIETELSGIRGRLQTLEPAEAAKAKEIDGLQRERESLQAKLRELGARETALRRSAERSVDLEQEYQSLEELLEEALEDVSQKDEAIQDLQERLQKASSATPKKPSAKGKARESERLGKRLKTLYKNIDVADRALDDLAGLGDESLKLRAEESLKRLSEDPDTASVRRKVGGLPPQLSIYEIGFAGKGRIYYSREDGARYRVLLVGGKASQTKDLEYLSRLAP